MSQRHDIVVIGAGIAGVASALRLHHQGRKVLLIDRREPGHETSYGNAGAVGNSYVLPFEFPSLFRIPSILMDRDTMARVHWPSLPGMMPWIISYFFKSLPGPRRRYGKLLFPLVCNAVTEHQALMKGTGAERHFSQALQVKLYRSKSAFNGDALTRKVAGELNVPFEVMDAAAFCAIEPDLRPAFHRAVRWSGGRVLDNPGAVVTAYAQRFVREGGELKQTEVLGIRRGESWIIETTQGDIAADNIVVCAGPWSGKLLEPLGYHFPMAMKRGYHQHFPAAGAAKLKHAITDTKYGYVLTPMEQGYRLTTGAEFAALDTPPNPIQIARILPFARELFPLGEPRDPSAWFGYRPCFSDSLPVIGPAPKHIGLWLNFGHGHMGMTTGPACGRLLAEMMSGKKPFCDPGPYRATRFSC